MPLRIAPSYQEGKVVMGFLQFISGLETWLVGWSSAEDTEVVDAMDRADEVEELFGLSEGSPLETQRFGAEAAIEPVDEV